MMLAAADPHCEAGPGPMPACCPADAAIAAGDARIETLLQDALHRVCPHSRLHFAGGADELRLVLGRARPALTMVDLDFVHAWPRELLAIARSFNAAARVIVVCGNGTDDALLAALRAGAAGFLLKHDPLDEVAAQLRSLLAGVLPMTTVLARQIIREADRTGVVFRLPRGDREVLAWIAAGDDLAQVADRLSISGDEILRRVDRICGQFGLRRDPGADGQET